MSIRSSVRCFALLLLLGGILGPWDRAVSAPPQQALDRARLLRTLNLLQHQAGKRSLPAAKAAQAAGDSSVAGGSAPPADADVLPAPAGTGAITGSVGGLEADAWTSASVMAWTDVPWMEGEVRVDRPSQVGIAPVAADGTYRIEGLAAGEYYVMASAQDYVPAYYDNVTDLSQATRLGVEDDQTVSGIDFSLERIVPGTGSIAGTVRSTSGRPVPQAAVYAYSPDNPFLSGKTATEADGSYVIGGLKTGRYYVEVWAEGFMQAFYNGVTKFEEATLVGVIEPSQTAGTDFTISTGGQISGTVRNDQGEPVAGAYVQATMPYVYGGVADSTGVMPPDTDVVDASGRVAARDGWAVTDESGHYRMGGLEAGEYYVMVQVPSRWLYAYEWYQDADSFERATPVRVVADEETSGIDFRVWVPTSQSAIAGRVTDGQGEGIAEAFITVQEDVDWTADPVRPSYVWAYATTDRDGRYVVEELPAGRYLLSAASQSGWQYVQRWYRDAFSPEEATPVVVEASQRVEGIDLVLPIQAGTASISGVVHDTQGNALAWAFIDISPFGARDLSADGSAVIEPVAVWAYGQTDEQGRYRVDRLPPGSYVVHASYGTGEVFGQGWYDGADSPEGATPVVLADGQARGDIDFRIAVRPLYGAVQGTVSNAQTGAPMARAYVELSPVGWDYAVAAPFRWPALYAVTDEAGRFGLTYVSEGTYVLSVYADGAYGQYRDPDADEEATPIQVIGGEVTQANVPLFARGDGDGRISGTVTIDYSGGGPGPLWEGDVGRGAADGGPGVSPGGQVVTVAGKVTQDGTPPEIAVVVASPLANADLRHTTVTQPDGSYTLHGLAPGDYLVMSFGPGLIGEYHEDAYGPQDADPVHIDEENPSQWVDFALSPIYYLRFAGAEGDAAGPASNAPVGVYGRVTDEAGNAVAGATVYLLDETEKPVAYVQSSPDGSYQLSGMVPGGYRVYASKLGYDGSYNGNAQDFALAQAIPLSGGQWEVNLRLSQGEPTAVEEEDGEGAALPRALALERNYPNPFNPTTHIAFTVPASGRAAVRVYDLLGQEVAVLFDGWAQAGRHEVAFRATNYLSTGTYFYTLEHGGHRLERVMTLLK
ncbi:MAG: carboxypeptidase regulatory-like domain-containing protein [Candidatus Latescibacterota bacterium]